MRGRRARSRARFAFPPGVEPPALLRAFERFVAGCTDYFSGDFEICRASAGVWFRDDGAAGREFAVFGHDGTDALYALWLHGGASAGDASVVCLGGDCTVLASSLAEFLGLLGHNFDRVGTYTEWTSRSDAPNAKTHARFLTWLARRDIEVPAKPRAVVDAARASHPDLEAWVMARLPAARSEPPGPPPTPDEALLAAIEDGDVKAVKRLLAAGATAAPRGGWPKPLVAAATQGNPRIAKLLLAAGAKLNADVLVAAATGCNLAMIEAALAAGLSPNAHDTVQTPLVAAAKHGHARAVRRLLARGADPNRRAPGGQLPLVEAVGGMGDMTGTIRALLDAGADVDGRDRLTGRTAVFSAAFLSADHGESVLRLLAERGANVRARDKRKRTPIQVASERRIAALLRMLGA